MSLTNAKKKLEDFYNYPITTVSLLLPKTQQQKVCTGNAAHSKYSLQGGKSLERRAESTQLFSQNSIRNRSPTLVMEGELQDRGKQDMCSGK